MIKIKLLDLLSRKFLLAFIIVVMAFIALLIGKIDGGTFVAASSIASGIFATSNVLEKKTTEGEI